MKLRQVATIKLQTVLCSEIGLSHKPGKSGNGWNSKDNETPDGNSFVVFAAGAVSSWFLQGQYRGFPCEETIQVS